MDTIRAKILFTELRDHLREYGGKNLKYQTRITEDAVNDLADEFPEEEKEKAVRKYFRYLWPGGRGGLSDVVLWDENLEKRIALNEPLARICRELNKLIKEADN
jgi:hypothetical protein